LCGFSCLHFKAAMHAPLQPDERELHKTWRHRDGAPYIFDSRHVTELFCQINANGESAAIDELLRHSEPLIKSLIKYRRADRHVPLDELLNAVRLKLWKSVRLFDPGRGTPYSFVAKVTESVMASAVADAWRRGELYCELSAELSDHVSMPDIDRKGINDIGERIRREIKTTATLPGELQAQRWYFQSLVASEFTVKRFQAADAAMQVYGLTHARARWLYDTVILEGRRVLINDRRLPMVPPHALRHTRIEALVRYARYLPERDFSRLVSLMRDLPPSLIISAKPGNGSAIRCGNPEAITENLTLVLNGDPAARRLFT